jgi:hypothetical protein
MNKNMLPFILAGVLLVLAVLLLIPASNQALLSSIGIDSGGSVGGGFDAFIPLIPGYFPEGFVSTRVGVTHDEAPGADTYSEFYASETFFFKTIQRQGPEVSLEIADPDLTIQGSQASLTGEFDAHSLIGGDLTLTQYDNGEMWLLTMVMHGIRLQVISNYPAEEVIRFAEELIPQRCTSTPTPEG